MLKRGLKKMNDKELEFVIKKYEEITHTYWLPTYVKEQELWILAFNIFKNYFKNNKED